MSGRTSSILGGLAIGLFLAAVLQLQLDRMRRDAAALDPAGSSSNPYSQGSSSIGGGGSGSSKESKGPKKQRRRGSRLFPPPKRLRRWQQQGMYSAPAAVRPSDRVVGGDNPFAASDFFRTPSASSSSTSTSAAVVAASASAPTSTAFIARPCPYNCSGKGVCNEGSGECLCRMGRKGMGCEQLDPFPCNLPHGEQLVNRCAGHCNLETSKCTCGGGKYPSRSMHKCEFKGMKSWIIWDGPGWDYARTAESPRHLWGQASDAPSYLREHPSFKQQSVQSSKAVAWCDADPSAVDRHQQVSMAFCTCNEGFTGRFCDIPVLHACLNQCNGRGKCVHGYCECDPSWYGIDCSQRAGKVMVVKPGPQTVDHALEDVDYSLGRGSKAKAKAAAAAAAAAATAAAATAGTPPPDSSSGGGDSGSTCPGSVAARQKARADGTPFPAIFVYELPISFNVELWTSKSKEEDCALRAYTHSNATDWKQHAFGMEVAVHETLLRSEHRVTDPSKADFFYVPVWGGCWLSRFSRPTPRHHDLYSMAKEDPEVRVPRAARASNVYRRAYEYIRTAYPFWNRTSGADHLWTFPHDEGACLAPLEINRSILISHWGRLMLQPNNHTSTSAGQGWHVPPHFKRMYGSYRCFEPGKDVLLPIYKSRGFVQASPYVTGKEQPRRVLFNFRGNAHLNQPQYSLGLRQQLYTLLEQRDDRCLCADPGRSGNDVLKAKGKQCQGKDPDGCLLVGGHSRDYIGDLQRSVFCGVLPGNGWGHIEEPVIHGCIPVIVMPDIHVQMEGVLDLDKFSVRVARDELPRLVDKLRAFTPEQVKSMQIELHKVWERYTYTGSFKHEFSLQDRPPDRLTKARVGAPPSMGEQKSHAFPALEPRLRGLDAVDGLVAHLGLRLAQKVDEQAGCSSSARSSSTPPRTQVERGWPGAPSTPTPYVDHGPPVPSQPPVNFHVWTIGVV